MKLILYISAFLSFISFEGYAQDTLKIGRSVIGSAGFDNETTNFKVSATVGETVISTESSTSFIVSQGFQQTLVIDTISFVFSSTNELCVGRANGTARLDSIGNCEGPYNIAWSNGDRGNVANNLTSGEYYVVITSTSNGCTKRRDFTIDRENEFDCLLKFYSGITPNNDGQNDKWIIDNLVLFPINKVNIYNRVGNRIWRGTNYDNSSVVWGGENLSGVLVSSGTYFYVFESGSEVEKGWIELTR